MRLPSLSEDSLEPKFHELDRFADDYRSKIQNSTLHRDSFGLIVNKLLKFSSNTLNSSKLDRDSFLSLLEQTESLCKLFHRVHSINDQQSISKLHYQINKLIFCEAVPANNNSNMVHKCVETTDSLAKSVKLEKIANNGVTLQPKNSTPMKVTSSIRTVPIPGPPIPPPPPSLFAKLANAFSKTKKVPQSTDFSKCLKLDLPKPHCKLRPVIWQKIPASKVSTLNGNVWQYCPEDPKWEAQSVCQIFKLDFTILDETFVQIQTPEKRPNLHFEDLNSVVIMTPEMKRKRESAGQTLLGAKRSLNVNIFLSGLKGDPKLLIDLIAQGDGGQIGVEKLEALLKLLPDGDETILLSQHFDDRDKFGDAERFLIDLISLDNYRLRLKSMLLKEDFDSILHRIKSTLDIISKTAEDVLKCRDLKDVLHLIFMIGSYINGSNDDTAGFRISSLSRIAEIKGSKPNSNFLGCLLFEIERNNKNLLEFRNALASLDEACCRDSFESISQDLKQLKDRVDEVDKQIGSISGNETKNQMSIFLNYAKRMLLSIADQQLKQCEDYRSKVADYFCEDRAQFRLDECFKVLRDFKLKFTKCLQQIDNRKLQLLKAEERKRFSLACGQQKMKFDTVSLGCDLTTVILPPYASPMMSRHKPFCVSQNKLCDLLLSSPTSLDSPNAHCKSQKQKLNTTVNTLHPSSTFGDFTTKKRTFIESRERPLLKSDITMEHCSIYNEKDAKLDRQQLNPSRDVSKNRSDAFSSAQCKFGKNKPGLIGLQPKLPTAENVSFVVVNPDWMPKPDGKNIIDTSDTSDTPSIKSMTSSNSHNNDDEGFESSSVKSIPNCQLKPQISKVVVNQKVDSTEMKILAKNGKNVQKSSQNSKPSNSTDCKVKLQRNKPLYNRPTLNQTVQTILYSNPNSSNRKLNITVNNSQNLDQIKQLRKPTSKMDKTFERLKSPVEAVSRKVLVVNKQHKPPVVVNLSKKPEKSNIVKPWR